MAASGKPGYRESNRSAARPGGKNIDKLVARATYDRDNYTGPLR